MLGILLFIFYPKIIDSELLAPLVLISITVFFWITGKEGLIIPKVFFRLFGMQLTILLYMYASCGDPVIREYMFNFGDRILFQNNMFIHTLIVFSLFSLGVIHGYNFNYPLIIFSNSVLIFSVLYCIYFLVVHYSSNDNLLGGLLVTFLLPYIFLSVSRYRNADLGVYHLIIFFLLGLFFVAASNRASFIAMIIFYVIYAAYPFFSKSTVRSILFLLFFCAITFMALVFYSHGMPEFFSDASMIVFDKPTDTGRPAIWFELTNYIADAPIYGYGIDQSSSHIFSFILGRDLSSHNTFFEILLRGGVLLLFLFLSFVIYVYTLFAVNGSSITARIGQSMVFLLIWQASWHEIGLTINIVINILFWLFWGVALGGTLKGCKNSAKIGNQTV